MGKVWNKYGEVIGTTSGKDYTDYSDRASAATPKTASQPWSGGSSSSSSSKSTSYSSSSSSRSSSSGSSSNKIDTSGLSGYALHFANAMNSGMNYDQASQYAAQQMGGSGLRRQDIDRILSGTGTTSQSQGIRYDPVTGYAIPSGYTPQQPQYPQITPEQISSLIGEQFQKLIYPYQQKMEELYNSRPQYTPRSWEQLLTQARSYANLAIDPQVSAIQRSLEQYRQSAEANKQAVEAAYASVPERTSRLMEEARAKALESAIARGAGQSGGVEWLTRKLQEPLLEQQQQLEAERASKLAEISNNLALAEKQAGDRLQELEKLRGQYAEQQAKALEELDYARAAGDWARAFEALNKMTSNAAAYQNMANQMVTALMPYLRMTTAQETEAKRDLTNTLGQTMGPIDLTKTPVVPVRQYITSNYGANYIDYDPVTDSIIISGNGGKKKIPVSSLWSYGGYFDEEANRAYLPSSVIEDILWGRL